MSDFDDFEDASEGWSNKRRDRKRDREGWKADRQDARRDSRIKRGEWSGQRVQRARGES